MAARKVSGLVREHADDLVRRLGIEKCAGIDEDVPAIHDKGVERAVVEDDDSHVLFCKSGDPQNRLTRSRAAIARSPRRG